MNIVKKETVTVVVYLSAWLILLLTQFKNIAIASPYLEIMLTKFFILLHKNITPTSLFHIFFSIYSHVICLSVCVLSLSYNNFHKHYFVRTISINISKKYIRFIQQHYYYSHSYFLRLTMCSNHKTSIIKFYFSREFHSGHPKRYCCYFGLFCIDT